MRFPPGAVTERGEPQPVITRVNLKRAALRWMLPGLALAALAGLTSERLLALAAFLGFAPLAPLALLEFRGENARATRWGDAGLAVLAFALGWVGSIVMVLQGSYLASLLGGASVQDALVDAALRTAEPKQWAFLLPLALPMALATHMRVRRLVEDGWRESRNLFLWALLALTLLGFVSSNMELALITCVVGLLLTAFLMGVYELVDSIVLSWETRRAR
jgi:hypothetical protein